MLRLFGLKSQPRVNTIHRLRARREIKFSAGLAGVFVAALVFGPVFVVMAVGFVAGGAGENVNEVVNTERAGVRGALGQYQ